MKHENSETGAVQAESVKAVAGELYGTVTKIFEDYPDHVFQTFGHREKNPDDGGETYFPGDDSIVLVEPSELYGLQLYKKADKSITLHYSDTTLAPPKSLYFGDHCSLSIKLAEPDQTGAIQDLRVTRITERISSPIINRNSYKAVDYHYEITKDELTVILAAIQTNLPPVKIDYYGEFEPVDDECLTANRSLVRAQLSKLGQLITSKLPQV